MSDETEMGDDSIDIQDVEIPDDISSADDLAEVDGIDVEREYWTDYILQHHGIVFSWRNNLKQIILAVEESIADEEMSDNFDIVLLDGNGKFITRLETVETEEEALKTALQYQHQYPQGDFPELEEESDEPSGFVPLNQAGYTQSEGADEEILEDLKGQNSKNGLLSRIKSLFS